MASDDHDIDERELTSRLCYGDDSTPLVSLVPESPPSHWGTITSQSRTLSAAYMKFLKGARDEPRK